ncbi:hypothetical protein ACQ4PT_061490 [Festuca glaucescens]
MARGLRSQAREARDLHTKGQHEEALARALEVVGANPGSALALNLVGSLHRHFGSAAWSARASDDDEAASTLELHHHQLALDAFSAAARIAPNCVMTAICHAEALAACSRLPDAQVELLRVCSMPEVNHMDPAVHHVGYDLVLDASTAKRRKSDALCKANLIMQDFEAMINSKVVPEEAAELLAGDAASADVRRRANLFSQRYPYSARAQLLLVSSRARACYNSSGENLQTENLQPLCSDETLKDGEKCEESEIHAVDSNSETMVDQRSTDPPIDVHESGLSVLAGSAEVELEKKGWAAAMELFNDPDVSSAAKLLGGDATADEVRRRATLFPQGYPYSVRTLLLRVYLDLQHVCALDLAVDKKRHLCHILSMISEAEVFFDCSLLIALFHTKVLLALDEFAELERECRCALRVEEPNDPSFDDIPPAVSVPSADYESRKQLCILLKRIIGVAAVCWSSIKSTQDGERVDRVISVRVDTLQQHYDGIDQSAAKTISDVVRFLQNQSSWSFFVCPNTSCHGKKFLDTESLWVHMRKKHRDVLWDMLQSVLGSDLYENTSKDDDHPFDAITLCRDSDQHDIFHLPMVQPMFESMLLSPSIGIQAEPLAEMRQRKCREGAEIIADIKKKLRMLPKDELITQICCADESYVCFARDDEDKWLIYDFDTVETEDTWEHLLEGFKNCKLQPQVLFFEVIK